MLLLNLQTNLKGIFDITEFLKINPKLNKPTAIEFRSIVDETQQESDELQFRSSSTERDKSCLPTRRVVFLKVHKTGSSTIANLFQRFGVTHNLNFAVPRKSKHENGYNYIGKPGEPIRKESLSPIPDNQTYDILWNHVVYNRTAFRSVMPNDTVYITIIREPFDQFVSAFEYFKIYGIQFIKNNMASDISVNPISAYLKNISRSESPRKSLSHIRNKMVADLGMTLTQLADPYKRIDFLRQLNKDFKLVMIMEYFDESLILLRRSLCWTHKDILYFPKNRNIFRPRRIFDLEDHNRHRAISFADYELYDFFYKEFNKKMLRAGDDVFEEVRYFRHLQKIVWDQCMTKKHIVFPTSKWSASFHVTQEECQMLRTGELAFLDYIMNITSAKYTRFLKEKMPQK
ncbi:hypothetical protein SNE40_023314 [Patella caerulea]|uniref:Galactosylceramide sulfotransferase-like n=1 Tax=Patella caerulea TaxID=87958 RepID=A0AAN8G651_PATCE